MERYNQYDHPDAAMQQGKRIRSNPAIVVDSPHNPMVRIVYDRLHIFLDKGRVAAGGVVRATVMQTYYLDPTDPTLYAHLVYLDGEFKNHDPARDAAGNWVPGVTEWALIEKKLPPGAVGTGTDEGEVKIRAAVIFRSDASSDVKIGWEIEGVGDVWENEEMVWDGRFSEFVSDP